jgi:hypothetical protein
MLTKWCWNIKTPTFTRRKNITQSFLALHIPAPNFFAYGDGSLMTCFTSSDHLSQEDCSVDGFLQRDHPLVMTQFAMERSTHF